MLPPRRQDGWAAGGDDGWRQAGAQRGAAG